MGRVYTNSIVLIYQVLGHAAKAGLDIGSLCESVGLDEAVLRNPDSRVPITTHQQLLTEVVERSKNRFFWLRKVVADISNQSNPTWYSFFNSATLQEGQMRGERFYRLLSDVIYPRGVLTESEYSTRFEIRHEDFVPIDYQVDWSLSGWWGLGQMLVGPKLELKEVRLTNADPERVRAYRDFFGAPVTTGNAWNDLVYERAMMDLPNINTDTDTNLQNLLTRFTEEKIALLSDSRSVSDSVHATLQHLMLHGNPAIGDVATKLGMSARTLQRKLTGEGHTFSGLVRDSRRRLAADYLRQRNLNITEVAMMLGFSDINSLTVAFRKWYGMSPTEYRRQSATVG